MVAVERFNRSGVLLGMVVAGSEDLTFAVPLTDVIQALECSPLLDR